MADDSLSEIEEWREVAGFPTYEVSDLGRIRRRSNITRRGHRVPIRILKASPDPETRYPRVSLSTGGKPRVTYRYVHVLVCSTFHGAKPSSLHEVAHGDGDRANNHADNLRWTTNAGNHLDRQQHGRAAKKLTAEIVRLIRSSPLNGKELAAQLGLSRSSINRVRSGETWGWLS